MPPPNGIHHIQPCIWANLMTSSWVHSDILSFVLQLLLVLRRDSKSIPFLKKSYQLSDHKNFNSISSSPVCRLLFCEAYRPSPDRATDPNVQKARDLLLKGVASGNPDTRQLAVMAASLIGYRSEILNKLYTMLETDKDVPVKITIISTLGSFNNPPWYRLFKKR